MDAASDRYGTTAPGSARLKREHFAPIGAFVAPVSETERFALYRLLPRALVAGSPRVEARVSAAGSEPSLEAEFRVSAEPAWCSAPESPLVFEWRVDGSAGTVARGRLPATAPILLVPGRAWAFRARLPLVLPPGRYVLAGATAGAFRAEVGPAAFELGAPGRPAPAP